MTLMVKKNKQKNKTKKKTTRFKGTVLASFWVRRQLYEHPRSHATSHMRCQMWYSPWLNITDRYRLLLDEFSISQSFSERPPPSSSSSSSSSPSLWLLLPSFFFFLLLRYFLNFLSQSVHNWQAVCLCVTGLTRPPCACVCLCICVCVCVCVWRDRVRVCVCLVEPAATLSLSLSLAHTHTHTHTHARARSRSKPTSQSARWRHETQAVAAAASEWKQSHVDAMGEGSRAPARERNAPFFFF